MKITLPVIVTVLGMFAAIASAQKCPLAESGDLHIAGSSTVFPVAEAWKKLFQDRCPGWTVNLRGGGSSAGARQVCNQELKKANNDIEEAVLVDEFAVDIGSMSRDWNEGEATPKTKPYLFDCSDSDREVIQVLVGYDGLSIAVAQNSDAAACINSLPNRGLTINQIRWIFSSYTDDQLTDAGWTNDLAGNSLNNVTYRTWAELGGSACPATPIFISGADDDSGTQEYFREQVFKGIIETFGGHTDTLIDREGGYFNSANDTAIINYLVENTNAIGYFGYAYAVASAQIVTPVAIENAKSGKFVEPTFESISSGEYYPFSRPIYMNIFNDPSSLARANPFIAMGFSPAGDAAVEKVGYVPASQASHIVGLTRLGAEGGADRTEIEKMCPATAGGSIVIGGSSTVFPIAELWAGVYSTVCDINVTAEGGGSSTGACRVCNQCDNTESGAVDIGDMSRQWREGEEASSTNGYTWTCAGTPRVTTQIEVAIDGLSVVTALMGEAHDCIVALGGLNKNQLRWIYSNLSPSELEGDGWSKSSVPFLDDDDSSHLWSELSDDTRCASTEIKIAGADSLSGTYDYMTEELFNEELGETFDISRSYYSSAVDEEVIAYLEANPAAIGYFGYSYVARNTDTLDPVPIVNNDGIMVKPKPETIESGAYPLSRRLYMNVIKDESINAFTTPFMEFGLSEHGQLLVEETGYSRIPAWENRVMHARVETEFSKQYSAVEWAKNNPGACGAGGFTIAGSSTVLPISQLWAGIYEIGCNVKVDVEGGGSSVGAARVCDAAPADTDGEDLGDAVDIGDMSREWTVSESTVVKSPCRYKCAFGNKTRETVQIQVATDGLTVAVLKGSSAEACVNRMKGLTIDQLRWIYSDLTVAQLTADGWNTSAVPFLDEDDGTHLWSELNSGCPAEEILISGADRLSGTHDFFADVVFHKDGESFDLDRGTPYFNSAVDETLVEYVKDNPNAISYFGFTYFVGQTEFLTAVPIFNPDTGKAVSPDPDSIASGDYFPLSRPLYMNLLVDSYNSTAPMVRFGFSDYGRELVEFTGYVPMTGDDLTGEKQCLDTIGTSGNQARVGDSSSGDEKELPGGAIAGISLAVVFNTFAILGLLCHYREKRTRSSSDPTGTGNLGTHDDESNGFDAHKGEGV